MDLRLSERQLSLQRSAAQFFAEKCPPQLIRQMEYTQGEQQNSDERKRLQAQTWQAFVRLGCTRLNLPTTLGGVGWGLSETIVVVEQTGRVLYQSPLLDTLASIDMLQAYQATGSQKALLIQLASGRKCVALALREQGSAFPADLSALHLSATEHMQGWTISGDRRFVPNVQRVQYFLLPAMLSAGPTFFLVPVERSGITCRRQDEISRGDFSVVHFEALELTSEDMPGAPGDAQALYERLLARMRVRQAAYLIGLCQGILDVTIPYTKKRQQFGQSLATFQSIGFRLASFATRIDAARLLLHATAWQADQGQNIRRSACELLALVSDLVLEWSADAMQMHGSYGLTEQAEVQRYYRHAAVEALFLGTPAQLRSEAIKLLTEEMAQPVLEAVR